jgi:hypothetical protein
MHDQIAVRLHDELKNDPDTRNGTRLIDSDDATREALAGAIVEHRPALVVTTSHGQTGPANDQVRMRSMLGAPVDARYDVLDPAVLLRDGGPGGAIWYSHACCSAGSDTGTAFAGLFSPGSGNDVALNRIGSLGAMTSPLSRMLLGARRPLRAFVGHVEPTFDWTLRRPGTGQPMCEPIVRALYNKLYTRQPIGYALREWHQRAGGYLSAHLAAIQQYNSGADNAGELLFCQLAARDIQSTVILGDPAVALLR